MEGWHSDRNAENGYSSFSKLDRRRLHLLDCFREQPAAAPAALPAARRSREPIWARLDLDRSVATRADQSETCVAKDLQSQGELSMRWITAKQLEDWARTLASRTELSKVVSDLIRASAPDVASIRFPSGDKGQVRGFDGHLLSNAAALNVPEGRSFWEFGTNEEYKAKAAEDFEKRTQQVSAADQRDTVFVMVSPWTWDHSKSDNKLEDFIASCRSDSHWKDVKYIDGSALESWLEHRQAVSAFHARNTLKVYPADGIRSTDEFWDAFAGHFGPPITEEVLLCERNQAAEQVIRDLMVPLNALSCVADSPDEVLAFAIAAIRKAPPQTRLFLEARTLVVDTVVAGRQLVSDGNLVLLLRGDPSKSPKQFSTIGTTLVPLGRQQRGVGVPILDRPTAHAMSVAMRSMGIEENRALTLARGCGRSLTALARLIPGGSYEKPAWVAGGAGLLPAILAGAWDTSNDRDRQIIEIIGGGVFYPQIESRVRAFLSQADPPFDLEGAVWKVRAPMDAFVHIGPLIGHHDAELLSKAMRIVFAEVDPEPDPHAIINLARSTGFSDWLREGLAMTLALLAVWGDVALVNLGNETGQHFADRVINSLPGLKNNSRLWTSLRNELSLFAEAAPDPLLSALEHMLEGTGEAIGSIFKERAGLLYPTSEHTGVLWALETIAWDPSYFQRAVMVLARLAAIDPGGRLSNRPSRSLVEIFLPWHPHTKASWSGRLAALDEIIRTLPEVGWNLLVALLPTTHGVSTPTAKPRLREAGAADPVPITYAELWANYAAVEQRAIVLAGQYLARWLELIRRIASFASKEREYALTNLDATLASLNANDRKTLWTKLRDEVDRHERFKDAPWALPESELVPFRSLEDKYAPTDPVTAILPLFATWAEIGSSDAEDHKKRIAALLQLYEDAGPEAVLQLATEAKVSYLVIQTAYSAGFSPQQIEQLLFRSFERDPSSHITLGFSGLYRREAGSDRAEAWISDLIAKNGASSEAVASILQGWPGNLETWNVVRRFGPAVVAAYWKNHSPHYLEGRRSELFKFILMLLRYGRAIEAIQSSLSRLAEIPSRLILRMLDGVIPQLNAKSAVPDTMSSYYIESAMEALDRRDDVSDQDIAIREYQFFPLLEYGNRHLRLYKLMAKDAALYHSFIRKVFRAEGEEKNDSDPKMVADARQGYSVLSHFSLLPGQESEKIDAAVLTTWIDQVRRLGNESGLADVTDSYVGRVLAHAKTESDGVWPPEAVRDQIERLASAKIEGAIQMERFNIRGAHFRAVFEGGTEERNFARASYDAAVALVRWPRTAALLRSIRDMWEEEAKREDVEAAQRRLKS
jgi:hypothetical protein